MRQNSEKKLVQSFRKRSSHPCAEIRSYQAIAGILTERYGRQFTVRSVQKRCKAAERRLAAGLRSDPLIQRWLRRQRIEVVDKRVGPTLG